MPQGLSLKSTQAVCMTALLHQENTHSSAWDQGVSEAPRNRDWISKRRLRKQRASAFIFNELLNGIPRTESFFFLTKLLPTYLQKAGRSCRNSSLTGGWRAGGRLTGLRLSVHPQISDQTAREEVTSNFQNQK